MFTPAASCKKQRPPSRAVVYFFLLPTLIWAFLGTIDRPFAKVAIDAGAVVYKAPKCLDRAQVIQLDSLWIGMFPETPHRVHAAFLLFDFKQNLRRWPNVAGDISRSPPHYAL